jgi:hypothetical protein
MPDEKQPEKLVFGIFCPQVVRAGKSELLK